MIQFFLIFNQMGQTRFAKYYTFQHAKERATLEGEVTRLYMGRREDECSVFEHRNYRCVYKLVNNLVYMIATDLESRENVLSLMSFIDAFVETLEMYFSKLVMFNLEKVHYIMDEMILNGTVYETNKDTITRQLALMKIHPVKEKEK
ncbi:adaptor protein complex 4, subunit sigma 2 [Blastocystis sp. ATCC 50177/Nand II]|uniref:AP complex subunit sigma n=1 Tax=Blastocystis sp. subtype 1 (strain ATCC 50177 / NandII) TaxID=478820 RepID=A0A196SIX9_BLAHN|nr:adaptor protein complex 4, subunit sigma 2 [Blastocystis sp. ATCC 50177/Nand II]